jgi:hypothetical protein
MTGALSLREKPMTSARDKRAIIESSVDFAIEVTREGLAELEQQRERLRKGACIGCGEPSQDGYCQECVRRGQSEFAGKKNRFPRARKTARAASNPQIVK